MTRMSRYLVREHAKMFFLCLIGLVMIYETIDLFEKIRSFITHKANLSHALYYFLLKLPEIIFEMTPIAVLLATFLSLGLMSRRNEMVSLNTGGIHPYRIITPFLLFGFISGLILFILNLSVIPSLNLKSKMVQKVLIEKKSPDIFFKQGKLWFRQNSTTIYNVQMIESPKNQMFGITIYKLNPEFKLLQEIEAKEMRYEKGTWYLMDGTQREFLDDGTIDHQTFERRTVQLVKSPDEFKRLNLRQEEMTYTELSKYIEMIKKEGYRSSKYAVDLHRKVAFPFASLIMAILAIPFALKEGVRTHLTKGIGLSLLFGISYWVVFSLFLSLGYGGVLPPWISAWLTNMVFLGIGLWYLSKINYQRF